MAKDGEGVLIGNPPKRSGSWCQIGETQNVQPPPQRAGDNLRSHGRIRRRIQI